MDTENIQAKLGRAGETIITNYYTKQGIVVEASVDQYDSEKDLIIDGKTVEVKTQVPFYTMDAFTFKPNQLKKCTSVDFVYFVSVPTSRYHFSSGKVYVIEADKLKYRKHKTNDGRLMIVVPIRQEGMRELFTMSESDSTVLSRYNSSTWK